MNSNTITRTGRLELFAIIIAWLVLAASAAANSTITLRASVRLPAEQHDVRLADVAVLEGEAVNRYGDLVIARLDDPALVLKVSVREVRTALDEAGVHWGRTHLNGREVVVRPMQRGTGAPMPMTPISLDGAEQPQPKPSRAAQSEPETAASIRHERTLRGAIADYLIHNLHVQADQLQIHFEQRYEDLLLTPLDAYRFEIEPVSGLRSARVDLAIRFWKEGRVERRETISASLLVHTPVVTLARQVDRGAAVTEGDLALERHWLAPGHPGLVMHPSEAIGRLAAIRLREGDMLRDQHIRRETLIRRGEQVIVRCIVGHTVISLQAEARADGGLEDTIEFRKLGERETFLATVTGRNEAVVDLRR